MISVLDYGLGNSGSVIRMIESAGGRAQRIATPDEVLMSKILVIPGVGAFDQGMSQLDCRLLLPALNTMAFNRRIPILGICLGMQLMCLKSEEGKLPGLGWINAEVKRLGDPKITGLRVPHIGWNTLRVVRNNPLLSAESQIERFYFVHSFKVCCNDQEDVISLTNYGQEFVSAFQRGNLFGVQFHPEKSHRFGFGLIKRFISFQNA